MPKAGMEWKDAAPQSARKTDGEWSGQAEISSLPYGIGIYLGLYKNGAPVASSHGILSRYDAQRLMKYLQRALMTPAGNPVRPPPGSVTG